LVLVLCLLGSSIQVAGFKVADNQHVVVVPSHGAIKKPFVAVPTKSQDVPTYIQTFENFSKNPQRILGEKDVYGPGVIKANLPRCSDSEFIHRLSDLLSRYLFTFSYSSQGKPWGTYSGNSLVLYSGMYLVHFDCSDMSRITWRLLKEYGYNAKLMLGRSKYTNKDHAWVAVKNGNCWVIIEATNRPSGTIGSIESPKKRFHILDYEEYYSGLMFNTSAEFMLYTDDTVPIYLDTPVHDLPIYRWNEMGRA